MITILAKNFITMVEAFYEREMLADKKRAKPLNNYSSATNRMRFFYRALEWLGDIETITGGIMSNNNPDLINIGDLAECILGEVFRRLNGLDHNTKLCKSYDLTDIKGRNAEYEIKYYFSNKYRCTALNPDSKAKFVYYVSPKGVYKIPYAVALASEVQYGNKGKYRAICLENIPDYEQYYLKTYSAIICG